MIAETKLVPVPSLADGSYHLYFDVPDTIYGSDATIRDVLDLDYSQFQAAIKFLYPKAEFSTEHGVKGEEYDILICFLLALAMIMLKSKAKYNMKCQKSTLIFQ